MSSEMFRAAGFVLLRTPLLPFDDLLAWRQAVQDADGNTRAALTRQLFEALCRPDVFEALDCASPSMAAAIKAARPAAGRDERVVRGAVKYLSRMAGRPMPFGLLAGCTCGYVAEKTVLRLGARETYQRRSQLDYGVIDELINAAISRTPSGDLRYVVNTAAYRRGAEYHLHQRAGVGLGEHARAASLLVTPQLVTILERAKEGATHKQLVDAVATADRIAAADATRYVDWLISRQVIILEAQPILTGSDRIERLADDFEKLSPRCNVARVLRTVAGTLTEIDQSPLGAAGSIYKSVRTTLAELTGPRLPPTVVSTTLRKPGVVSIDAALVADILSGMDVLRRWSLPPRHSLRRFCDTFETEYGNALVPLPEVIEGPCGAEFRVANDSDARSVDAGLDVFSPLNLVPEAAHSKLAALVRLFEQASGQAASEIDVKSVGDVWKESPADDMPGTAAAVCTLGRDSLGHRVCLHYVLGAPGSRLLGRFCDADPELFACVVRYLRDEERLTPDAVFAEVVYASGPRNSNVSARPHLREYEIAYLARSGAKATAVIDVTDLLVSVIGGRVVLRSRRLNREVVPRMSSAHNYRLGAPLYQLLGAMQTQHEHETLCWDWGPFESARVLPRVVSNRVVLSRARWMIDAREVIGGEGTCLDQQQDELQAWRQRLKVPRWVVMHDGDAELPVDLDNVLSVDLLLSCARRSGNVSVSELWPCPSEMCVDGPEGRYLGELVVPLIRVTADEQPASGPAFVVEPSLQDHSWAYAKLYTSPAMMDVVLIEVVFPIVEAMAEEGLIDSWHFVRFADPSPHLRVRLHAAKCTIGTVIAAFGSSVSTALKAGLVARLQYEPYRPETTRYGGDLGRRLAERLFHTDSDAAIGLLKTAAYSDPLATTLLSIRSMDRLLVGLGWNSRSRHAIVCSARDQLIAMVEHRRHLMADIGKLWRTNRNRVTEIYRSSDGVSSVLDVRSRRLQPVVDQLLAANSQGALAESLESLTHTFIHLVANRLLPLGSLMGEITVYDHLARLYRAGMARTWSTGH